MKMKSVVCIVVICVCGYGIMDNVSFSFYVYKDLFLDVVNYFVCY